MTINDDLIEWEPEDSRMNIATLLDRPSIRMLAGAFPKATSDDETWKVYALMFAEINEKDLMMAIRSYISEQHMHLLPTVADIILRIKRETLRNSLTLPIEATTDNNKDVYMNLVRGMVVRDILREDLDAVMRLIARSLALSDCFVHAINLMFSWCCIETRLFDIPYDISPTEVCVNILYPSTIDYISRTKKPILCDKQIEAHRLVPHELDGIENKLAVNISRGGWFTFGKKVAVIEPEFYEIEINEHLLLGV